MKTLAWVLTICASASIALLLPCKATAQESGVGVVEEIHGTVFYRQNARAKQERLDSRSDFARRLYPGEQVRCGRRSSISFRLGRKNKTIRGPSGWFTIPAGLPSQSSQIQKMLDDYGRLGGRDRGESSQVFSPSDHSVVVPQQFSIRWTPSAAGCALSFIIKDVGGDKVWEQDKVDGSSGFLNSDDARRKLTDYRAKTGQGPLTLTLDDSCGSENHVTFLLLSVTSEQTLNQDLAFWSKENGMLLSYLGRASVFSRYGMFPQAAEEYEAALKAAPHSRSLLIRTIIAHRQMGNFVRAEELEKRLPRGTNIQ